MILQGKYRLLEVIGSGAMGVVFEAIHLNTDRRVALKCLSAERAKKGVLRKRFEREARAAARIDHDNICEVLDYGVAEDGSCYLVMPLLQGSTLSDTLRKKGALTLERIRDIMNQVLDALAAAHEKGVVHRDLKPDNIFLTKVGDRDDFVKILDFGVIKLEVDQQGDEEAISLTNTGAVVGTPYYMAPEQARGERDVDGRVDIYAFGVVLYEILTGHRPFKADSYSELLWKIWNDPIQPPRAFCPSLSDEMQEVVLRALARDPGKRFPTIEALREALSAAFLVEMSPPGRASCLLSSFLGPTETALTGTGLTETLPPQAESIAESHQGDEDAPTRIMIRVNGPPDSGPPASGLPASRLRPRHWAYMVGAAAVAVVLAIVVVSRLTDQADPLREPLGTARASSLLARGTEVGFGGDPDAGQARDVADFQIEERADADVGQARDVAEPQIEERADADAGQARDVAEFLLEEWSGADAESERVRITLSGVPENAEIVADGRAVTGAEILARRSGQGILVEVRAEGYQPWERRLSTEEDATVVVDVVRTQGGRRGSRSRSHWVKRPPLSPQPRAGTGDRPSTEVGLTPVGFGERP